MVHEEPALHAPPAYDDDVPGPTSITAKTICEDPKFVLYEDFISPEEVAHLLTIAEDRWARATVSRGKASVMLGKTGEAAAPPDTAPEHSIEGEEVYSEGRTGSTCRIGPSETLVCERVAARVATVAGHPLENIEDLVLVKYREGEVFTEHHDGASRPKTVFVYFNEVDGGCTRFPQLGFEVRPKAYTAVMWPNLLENGVDADPRMFHESTPVGPGCIKYGMNCFVSSRKQRDCRHVRIHALE